MPTHHVIVGGGPAATNAIETIRQFDGNARITLICDEPAHSRMTLPYWLSGQIPREHTMTADEAYYQKLDVNTRIGARVTKLNSKAKSLMLSQGEPVTFDNLLIATGSTPIGVPIPGVDLPGVQPLWTLAHTQTVLEVADRIKRPRVVMLGSGFIGLIVLNAMYKRGWQLAVVEREPNILSRMLNADAAAIVKTWLAHKGVDVHCGTVADRITTSNSAKVVELANGKKLDADLVIVATGVEPNIEMVKGTDIQFQQGTDGGIPVNARMQTNVTDIYASGDVAKGPNLLGGRPAVHAIQTTAVDHGRIAGANMAGQDVEYPGSLVMNILDVCGLQCASFGNWSSANGDAMTISNPDGPIYRKLLWTGDQITGSIFLGQASDMGMLTDVGMVKGIIQTRTPLGPWKGFLAENPFDIRRPYIAARVAETLVRTTLLGRPAQTRRFQFRGAKPDPPVGPSHRTFISTRES